MPDLDQVLIGSITLRQGLYAIGGLAGLIWLLGLRKTKHNAGDSRVPKKCRSCRYNGRVLPLIDKCPNCKGRLVPAD